MIIACPSGGHQRYIALTCLLALIPATSFPEPGDSGAPPAATPAAKSRKPAKDATGKPSSKPDGQSSRSGSSAASSSDYLIRPGDAIRITVWKEPDLSSDVTVGIDGKVTLPLLGDFTAWLKTRTQLNEEIAKELQRFVDEPQVTVTILQANSARFFMIGQVGKQGAYPLTGQVSVLQAIALAGGFSPFAKRHRLLLFRGVDGSDGVIEIDFKKLSAGDIRQNFVLQAGDTIVVP